MTFKLPHLDLPTTVICVLTVAAFVFAQTFDPDYFFHLRTGEWLIEHRTLPHTDPFSFTRPDAEWMLFEWLFQVILFLTYDTLGTIGVRGLVALLAFATFAMIYRAARRMAPETTALAVAIIAIGVLLSSAAPRPQWVTYAMFATFLWALVTYLHDRSLKALILLPCLMLVWANAHGGFLAGILLIGFALASQWISARTRIADPDGAKATVLPLLLCFVACVLVAAINPYGFDLLLYPLKVTMTGSTRLIMEWQSPTVRQLDALAVFALIGILLLAQLLRDNRPTVLELVLPLAFFVMALDSRRHLTLAAIAVTPFLAKALADGAARQVGLAFKRALSIRSKEPDAPTRLTRSLGQMEVRLNWGLLVMMVGLGALLLPTQDQRYANAMNQYVGWRAIDFIADRGISGRGLNEYGFGGYHMYRLRTGAGPFIDGRADTYGDAFVGQYLRIVNGLEGWEVAFDRYNIDYVVVARTAPIRQLLLLRGDFQDVYRDAHNVVLVRKGFAPTLARIEERPV